ncbi:MAG: sulfurtransferase [Aquificae bacterium]|nr:sulfurtransferase [Aquificota bacterium]
MGNGYLTGRVQGGLVLILLLVSLTFGVPKLVPPEWLKENLGREDLVILEFSDEQSFLIEGHIPGAVLTEKEEWRRMDEQTGALVRKSPEEYEELFREWGINNESTVVIYYKGNKKNDILGAVYAYWIFRLLGHERVGILDGGWKEWIARNYPVSYEEEERKKGNFTAKYDPTKEVFVDYVLKAIGKIPILDGRLPSYYFGTEKFPAARKYGHVPCSVPFPWEWWVKKDPKTGKLYVDFPEYARDFLRNQGIKKEEEVILFCFGGSGAAFLFWVMDTLGYRGMRVYDASKREWEHYDLPLNRYVWETFRDCRAP